MPEVPEVCVTDKCYKLWRDRAAFKQQLGLLQAALVAFPMALGNSV